jgi:hypothetical protein
VTLFAMADSCRRSITSIVVNSFLSVEPQLRGSAGKMREIGQHLGERFAPGMLSAFSAHSTISAASCETAMSQALCSEGLSRPKDRLYRGPAVACPCAVP